MSKKKDQSRIHRTGLKPIRGGIEVTQLAHVKGGGGCFCSPGGHMYGLGDPCGCACACRYNPPGPKGNHNANDDIGNPET